MTDLFSEIRERLTMEEVAERYGFEPNRQHKICCPFHNDSHPSLQLYKGGKGWWCYVCDTGGSVLDFTANLFSLSVKEAAAKLNQDFSLGLPIGERLSKETQRAVFNSSYERLKQKKAHQMAEKAAEKAYWAAFDEWVRLDTMRREHRPTSQNEAPNKRFLHAIHEIGFAEHELDCAEIALYKLRNKENSARR